MVSHGLDSMIAMCERLVWLDHGQVRLIGEPAEVVAAYRGENI